MSLPRQEAVALGRAYGFLLALSSGEHPARPIRDLRAEARDIVKHYPLDAANRWVGGSLYDDIAAMSTNADINN